LRKRQFNDTYVGFHLANSLFCQHIYNRSWIICVALADFLTDPSQITSLFLIFADSSVKNLVWARPIQPYPLWIWRNRIFLVRLRFVILNVISIFWCAVQFWVELKAFKRQPFIHQRPSEHSVVFDPWNRHSERSGTSCRSAKALTL
jgi:hypothetical protein